MKERKQIMSGPKAILSNGWCTLNTINDFDIGTNNSSKDISNSGDFSKAVVKSLFIESLIDQLCKLLEKDSLKRHKLYEGICSKLHEMHLIEDTYHVEELASLRGHYQQALLDLMIAPDTRLCSMPCIKLGSSRYATEYEELCFLAAGGFGKVFKAKNHLDQVIYAIKKVPLRCQNVAPFARKLNEVKTLAKLNHPNIVQYKAAWLEPLFNVSPTSQSPDTTNFSSNDSDVVFESSQSSSKNDGSHLPQKEKENGKMALCSYHRGNSIQRPVMQVSALLYVSMQLCDGTLCEWLHNRNFYNEPVNVSIALYIMLQAVTGVQYLHSCNVVHHDIKPRNIFLSSDLKSVQVGDFGLSCRLQGHDHSDCPLEGGQFGTPLYAAPEQLKGCCDSKSDMFSLGLIFIELLTVFSTEMERVKVLTKARSRHIPSSIPLPLVPVIKNLISHQPNKRATATELIATLHDMKPPEFRETIEEECGTREIENVSNVESELINEDIKSSLIEERDQLMKDKDREITELRQMLAQKENEIAQLKNLVNQDSS